ncbi:unnamed protein product [Allacma fusca]|uniref:Uncharacterized protein n=1 Tax=Allacma fusca TaxID=39272 RepID=A0A8J2JX45_9HEXA|nr:unnamed protein product [Allacma fusca]
MTTIPSSDPDTPLIPVIDLIKHIIEFPVEDKVIDFVQPDELEKQLEEKLALPKTYEEIKATTDFVIQKCLNTSHRYFLNQLYGAVHPVGLAGAYIVEKMNTNQ